MTFTEAAVHVLRLVGKPLHYKEITDVAIEKDLLSHVGKSPEVTMGARLAAIVKKGSKETPLTRIKPGVFALSDWDDAMIEQGLNDRTPALQRIADRVAQDAELAATTEDSVSSGGPGETETAVVKMGQDEIARAELTAAATELFAPEEDDDEPILGNLDEDEEEDDDEVDLGGKRRRRRRRGRRGNERDDDLPAYTVSDVSEEVTLDVVVEARKREERPRDADRREVRERDGARPERGERERPERERVERERPERERPERERPERDRPERDRPERAERERSDEQAGERSEARLEDLRPGRLEDFVGAELATLVEALLGEFRRQGGASAKQVAELAVRKGRAQAADGHLASLISVACQGDNLRRQALGERPRFRLGAQGRLSLTEWGLDRELLKIEKEMAALGERYQGLLRQRLVRRISELPPRALGELVMLLLERLDYTQFQIVKRGSAHPAELHLTAVQKSAVGDVAVAIVVRRDGRDIGRERVTDLRGSLHHYGRPSLGLLVTTGQVMSGAREEANAPGATPVTFVDGARLSQLCEQLGVGVCRTQLSLSVPDAEFFDALRVS